MTTETMTITIGKPLGVTPPFEGYMPVLNGSSFSIIAFFSRVTIQDRKDWLVGKAQYGLYSENGIPIFLLDLGKTWSLDVNIQPKKIVLLPPRRSFKPRTLRHSGKRFN